MGYKTPTLRRVMTMIIASLATIASGGVAHADSFSPWSTAALSEARYNLAATSANGKVLFAGGAIFTGSTGSQAFSTVDVYDRATDKWTVEAMIPGRYLLAATSWGNVAYFGGGAPFTAKVLAYDTATKTWDGWQLSQARTELSATSAGGKVFFAGGNTLNGSTNVVDIYDVTSNTWSVGDMTHAALKPSVASANGKAFFTSLDVVDIYDTANGSWSSTPLSQPRGRPTAVSAEGKVYFVGGRTNGVSSNAMDIYDTATDSWSSKTMPQPHYFETVAAAAGGKLFFTPVNIEVSFSTEVDIYDIASDSWSVSNLSQPRTEFGLTALDNQVFFGGGFTARDPSRVVDIYTVPEPSGSLAFIVALARFVGRRKKS
jgi:hypothetical protein